ncbi:MAG: hypothetical protein J3K34DRAFT_516785 [Monoraphidium minutum]|nr:MAG: hypothetical protein J3K34DRAFT_516785 [Monoraphidium minutum]
MAAALAAATLAALAWAALAADPGAGSGGEGPPLLRYEFKPLGRVESAYGVSEGYWRLGVNHSAPRPGLLARARLRGGGGGGSSCWDLARAYEEPYSSFYAPRGAPPQPFPGGAPRAAWRWRGRIGRDLFDSAPFVLRGRGGCLHCTFVLRYKVLGGRLYVDAARRRVGGGRRDLGQQEEEAEVIEEMLLAALHLFQVPDADVLVHLGDGAPEGLPLLQANIDRGVERAGFAIPKRMWLDALGPQQMALLHECLEARGGRRSGRGRGRAARAAGRCCEVRYPRTAAARDPRAVWRGANTDRTAFPMDESNALGAARTRLHIMGSWYPHLLDAQITSYSQAAWEGQCVEQLLPPGRKLPLEGFNAYALILDADGNGWSDRLRLLAHFNTPILKQARRRRCARAGHGASNLTGFFEHLLAPGSALEHYSPSLHDLPVRAEGLLAEWAADPARLWRTADQHQGLAAAALNQVALAEAMAAAVSQAAALSDWAPAMEPGYEPVPFERCCPRAPALPRGFVDAVRGTRPAARGGAPGGGGGAPEAA